MSAVIIICLYNLQQVRSIGLKIFISTTLKKPRMLCFRTTKIKMVV